MLPPGSGAPNGRELSRRKPENGHFGTHGAPFVGVDTETTGVDAARDRIVEIAVITLDEALEPVEEFVARVNPGIPIPEAATRVHGITDQDVADCPRFDQIAVRARRLIGDRVMIAHNAPFDLGVLNMEFERARVEALPLDAPAIDTLYIEGVVNARTLEACLLRYTGQQHRDAHSARSDVLATLQVLKGQIRNHADVLPQNPRCLTRERIANLFGHEVRVFLDPNRRFYRSADGRVRFNFGRHRDQLVSSHPGFVRWMCRKGFADREIAIARQGLAEAGLDVRHLLAPKGDFP